MNFSKMPHEMRDHIQQAIDSVTRVDGECLIFIGKMGDRISPALGLSWRGEKFNLNIRKFLWQLTGRRLDRSDCLLSHCGEPRCVAVAHAKRKTKSQMSREVAGISTTKRYLAVRASNIRRTKIGPEDVKRIQAWQGPRRVFYEQMGISKSLFYKVRRDRKMLSDPFRFMIHDLKR